MEKEFKTNQERLQELYAKLAYLRARYCETQGILQRLEHKTQSCRKQIYEVENKIVKENEEA